jgi:hypothetical protein
MEWWSVHESSIQTTHYELKFTARLRDGSVSAKICGATSVVGGKLSLVSEATAMVTTRVMKALTSILV